MLPRILSFEPPFDPEFDGEPASWTETLFAFGILIVCGLAGWGGAFAALIAWKMGWL